MPVPEFHTYKFRRRKGIDDLQSIYAFTGASQGDESFSNDIRDNNEWMRFNFAGIDPTDQEAINAESIRRQVENDKYIARLKESGEYGKEEDFTVHFKPLPMFENPPPPLGGSFESQKLVFL